MVLAYSYDAARPDPELDALRQEMGTARARFLEVADTDARSYELVRAARRARKAAPGDPTAETGYVSALRGAAEVPLGTARLAARLSDRLRDVQARTKAALTSDLVTARALFEAATRGALANVEINLVDLKAVGAPTEEMQREVARLRAPP